MKWHDNSRTIEHIVLYAPNDIIVSSATSLRN